MRPRKVKAAPPAPVRLTGLVAALRQLKVGQALDIPWDKRGSAYPCAKAASIRVTVATVVDGKNKVARIWRTQ